MMNTQVQNLDIECALFGEKIAEIEKMSERIITAAIGVLEEQGLYAMCLYLKAREKGVFDKFEEASNQFLSRAGINLPNESNILKRVEVISHNLDQLLFVRGLFLQALSYARYYLKAKE